ncbi:hypothetical protein HMPREF0044_1080 [Gleimia coleocanis DSM 15436]|uniref:Uncharacterized protein n=1 Tax=Gleimia coleocanis DSM 15436 TaxID=525245 RepID=C0W0K2_9ACTO|nr:hypothetical protein [Gleimia coleocanis]EEH64061.1 hypothetical protein HMPREF0044_1080 [Gleimia coleocanis DSM 15436]
MNVRDLTKIETLEELRDITLTVDENEVLEDSFLSEQLTRLGVKKFIMVILFRVYEDISHGTISV